MGTLRNIETLLDKAVFFVAALSMIAMVSLVVIAVVMRYLVGAPLIFSFDLSTLLFAWTIFLGLGLAERARAHLAVGIIDDVLPARARKNLIIVRQMVAIVISLAAAWFGWKLFQRAGMVIPSLRVSISWLYASMPAGFALLALAQISGLLRQLFDVADESSTC